MSAVINNWAHPYGHVRRGATPRTEGFMGTYLEVRAFPGGTSGKEPACQCRRGKRRGFDPWVRKIPWRRAWQPTPVFLPGESMDRGAWQATVHRVAQPDTTEVT